MPASPRSSRLVSYSTLAAAAVGGTVGGIAEADTYSGTTSYSFGRADGIAFTAGLDNSGTYGGFFEAGNLDIYLVTSIASASNDAHFSVFAWQYNNRTAGSDGYWATFLTQSVSNGTTSWSHAGVFQNAGQTFSDGGHYSGSTATFQVFWGSTGTSTYQYFMGVPTSGTHYLNFTALGDEEYYYGWLAFDFDITDADNWTITLSGWAYNDAGVSLAAGSTAVPGLGGLAALAVGAAGVRGRRQRAAG